MTTAAQHPAAQPSTDVEAARVRREDLILRTAAKYNLSIAAARGAVNEALGQES